MLTYQLTLTLHILKRPFGTKYAVNNTTVLLETQLNFTKRIRDSYMSIEKDFICTSGDGKYAERIKATADGGKILQCYKTV